jgi:HK97 family phage major capsid protein
MRSSELREKRAKLIADARAICDTSEKAGRSSLNTEEQASYDKLWKDVVDFRKEIDRLEQLEAEELGLTKSVRESAAAKEDRGGSVDPAKPTHNPNLGPAYRQHPKYREAFQHFIVGESREKINAEVRALQADLDVSGGYLTAPTQFVQDLIKTVDDQVFIRKLATVRQVPTARSLGVPSLDADPADSDWTAELGTGSEDSTMAFGDRELNPHPLAKRIKISNKLLRMDANVEELVRSRLAYKFGIAQEKAFLLGTGAQQPLGLFTASTNGIPTGRDKSLGTGLTITGDGLKDAKYFLKGNYWPRAQWLFHRDGVKIIAKLKDTTNQYLWQDSIQNGEPDRLLGFPVNMSEYVPNTFTNGLYVGMLGDFSNYWIADAMDMQIQRLLELYAETNQTGLIGRLETDGMPVLSEAFVRCTVST